MIDAAPDLAERDLLLQHQRLRRPGSGGPGQAQQPDGDEGYGEQLTSAMAIRSSHLRHAVADLMLRGKPTVYPCGNTQARSGRPAPETGVNEGGSLAGKLSSDASVTSASAWDACVSSRPRPFPRRARAGRPPPSSPRTHLPTGGLEAELAQSIDHAGADLPAMRAVRDHRSVARQLSAHCPTWAGSRQTEPGIRRGSAARAAAWRTSTRVTAAPRASSAISSGAVSVRSIFPSRPDTVGHRSAARPASPGLTRARHLPNDMRARRTMWRAWWTATSRAGAKCWSGAAKGSNGSRGGDRQRRLATARSRHPVSAKRCGCGRRSPPSASAGRPGRSR